MSRSLPTGLKQLLMFSTHTSCCRSRQADGMSKCCYGVLRLCCDTRLLWQAQVWHTYSSYHAFAVGRLLPFPIYTNFLLITLTLSSLLWSRAILHAPILR